VKSIAFASGMTCLAFLSGCSQGVKPVPVSQALAVVCPQLSLVNSQLAVFNAVLIANPATKVLGTKANADLAAAQAPVTALCTAGAAVTSTQLTTALEQALPALGTIVGTLPLPPAQEAQIQGALVLAEGAVGLAGVVEQQIAAAKAVNPQ
jgi:hypothetical protein